MKKKALSQFHDLFAAVDGGNRFRGCPWPSDLEPWQSGGFLQNPGHLAMSTTLFKKALRAVENFHSPRAIAFCLVGMHAYLDKFSGDSDVRRVREILANRLFDQFKNHATDDWPWLENALNYANGKLPHALLLSGQRMQRSDMVDMGLVSLKWLLAIQTEDNHFVPIGSNGWYGQGGPEPVSTSSPSRPAPWSKRV
jgi:hypothetical protein